MRGKICPANDSPMVNGGFSPSPGSGVNSFDAESVREF
jgi:hypothetical protein